MKKDLKTFSSNMKQLEILAWISLGLLIISFLIYPPSFQTFWPYLVMTVFLLIIFKFRDVKITMALVVSLLALMVIMQATFYFIIPSHNNYQPTPTLPKMQIFDLAGKFQISYYPDIPKSGRDVALYFELCDVGLTNCTPCKVCTLTGKFTNEKEEDKILFYNISTNRTGPITFIYPGREVEVTLEFEGIDNRYNTFYIPKLNFFQSIVYFYNEHLLFGLLSALSLLIFILGTPYSIYRMGIIIKRKTLVLGEKKRKRKIKEILAGSTPA